MDGKKNNIAKWVDRGINVCFYLCLLVVAYVVLQVFVVTSFSIPSDSMEPTLLPGDKILVEKCATGARLFDLPAALAREEVKIYRVPGWRKFRRNDVLVFNFPYREGRWDSIAFDVTKYFVKRCIALPGDTVEIRGGYYHLRGVDAPVGNLQAQAQVAALTEADTMRVVLDSYPWDKTLGWTIQHFGPLAVPRRGQTVRYFVNFVLLLALCACGWFLYDQSRQPTVDLVAETKLKVDVPELVLATIEARKSDENARISGTPIDADCFVWGPFEGRQMIAVQSTLKQRGLLQKAEISDRFLPDRWIVYLGPYSNDIAVRAFVKQFRQQGYKNVRPILSGALSYGVEIETFESKEQAQAWINDKKAPDVKGLRVTNRLGEPSDKVDLVFRNLTEDQRQALFAIWKRWQGTEIQNCSFYQK